MKVLTKPKKKVKSVSDRHLEKLTRWAVLALFGNKCYFCGAPSEQFDVDVHHVVHRGGHFVLKWDWHDGVSACRRTHFLNDFLFNGKSCHEFADSPGGHEAMKDVINFEYLGKMALYTKPQYLSEYGMTENEFRLEKAGELKGIIEGCKGTTMLTYKDKEDMISHDKEKLSLEQKK